MERPDHLPLVTVSVLNGRTEETLNLRKSVNEDDSEGPVSPCSIVSIASSKESVARLEVHIDDEGVVHTRVLGLSLALLSGVLMTVYSSLLKLLEETPSMQVVVVRGMLQQLVMALVLMKRGTNPCSTSQPMAIFLLTAVAATGGLRILFIFTSFTRLPLGDSTTILFSSPVLVITLSVFLLDERCGVFRFVAACSLVLGVVLIAKPPLIFGHDKEDEYDVLGYSLVLLATTMSAVGIVLTKLLANKVEKPVILFYLGLAAAICGTVGLVTLDKPRLAVPVWEWILTILIGILGLVQQYCLVWAVQLESPARVTVVRSLQIILAYAVQVVMFDQVPLLTDLIGAILVLATVIAITFEKQITEQCDVLKIC